MLAIKYKIFIFKNSIERIEWSDRSPNLNLIWNIWVLLKMGLNKKIFIKELK